jgi:hypothetical protein
VRLAWQMRVLMAFGIILLATLLRVSWSNMPLQHAGYLAERKTFLKCRIQCPEDAAIIWIEVMSILRRRRDHSMVHRMLKKLPIGDNIHMDMKITIL